MTTRLVITGSLDRYFEVMEERPELFASLSGDTPICLVTDKNELYGEQEKARKRARKLGVPAHFFTLGIVFEDEWYYGLRDLFYFPHGVKVPVFRTENKIGAKSAKIVVIPYSKGRVLLIRYFGKGKQKQAWETPRGCGDPALDIVANGRRELLEQVGMVAASMTPIFHDNKAGKCVLLAHAIDGHNVPPVAESKVIAEMRWVTLREVQYMITAGEITDAALIAAYMYLQRFDFPE
jgi:hypothetical protein